MSKSGGLLQLVAVGRQDIYLSGNPQTTFFKQVYRRYTNFSIETQRIPIDTAVGFGKLHSLTVPQQGDLLSQLVLEVDLPAVNASGAVTNTGCSGIQTLPNTTSSNNTANTYSWVNGIGHAMIEYVSIQIGQQEIDRQTGEWLQIWSRLSTPKSKIDGFNTMIAYQEPASYAQNTNQGPYKLFIPLRFWFCNNIGTSLPLIALQSTPIRIYIKLKSGYDMIYSNSLLTNPCEDVPNIPYIKDMTLWGDFIYLDVEERRRFVTNKHEYLIEQTQYIRRYAIPEKTINASIPLTFNHPMKEIVWVVQQDRMLSYHDWFNWGSRALTEGGVPNLDLISSAVLQFDGFDRFERRAAQYFRLVQPWQRHTSIPPDLIYAYSFSLAPEASQPQGSCNASRIDSIVLAVEMNSAVQSRSAGLTAYATNYNVLRIVAGLGGVLFTV